MPQNNATRSELFQYGESSIVNTIILDIISQKHDNGERTHYRPANNLHMLTIGMESLLAELHK